MLPASYADDPALSPDVLRAALPQFDGRGTGLMPKPSSKEIQAVPYGDWFTPNKNPETNERYAMADWKKQIPKDQFWSARLVARFTDTGRVLPPAAEKKLGWVRKRRIVVDAVKPKKAEEPNQVVQVWVVRDVAGKGYLYVLGQPAAGRVVGVFSECGYGLLYG